jgi:hypothetical protein
VVAPYRRTGISISVVNGYPNGINATLAHNLFTPFGNAKAVYEAPFTIESRHGPFGHDVICCAAEDHETGKLMVYLYMKPPLDLPFQYKGVYILMSVRTYGADNSSAVLYKPKFTNVKNTYYWQWGDTINEFFALLTWLSMKLSLTNVNEPEDCIPSHGILPYIDFNANPIWGQLAPVFLDAVLSKYKAVFKNKIVFGNNGYCELKIDSRNVATFASVVNAHLNGITVTMTDVGTHPNPCIATLQALGAQSFGLPIGLRPFLGAHPSENVRELTPKGSFYLPPKNYFPPDREYFYVLVANLQSGKLGFGFHKDLNNALYQVMLYQCKEALASPWTASLDNLGRPTGLGCTILSAHKDTSKEVIENFIGGEFVAIDMIPWEGKDVLVPWAVSRYFPGEFKIPSLLMGENHPFIRLERPLANGYTVEVTYVPLTTNDNYTITYGLNSVEVKKTQPVH